MYKINCFKLLSFTSVFKLKCFMTSSEMGTSIIFHISCFCYQMLEKDERHIGVQSCSWWILMNQTHHLKTGGSLEIVSEATLSTNTKMVHQCLCVTSSECRTERLVCINAEFKFLLRCRLQFPPHYRKQFITTKTSKKPETIQYLFKSIPEKAPGAYPDATSTQQIESCKTRKLQ